MSNRTVIIDTRKSKCQFKGQITAGSAAIALKGLAKILDIKLPSESFNAVRKLQDLSKEYNFTVEFLSEETKRTGGGIGHIDEGEEPSCLH